MMESLTTLYPAPSKQRTGLERTSQLQNRVDLANSREDRAWRWWERWCHE